MNQTNSSTTTRATTPAENREALQFFLRELGYDDWNAVKEVNITFYGIKVTLYDRDPDGEPEHVITHLFH
jgi:hypothetical protein